MVEKNAFKLLEEILEKLREANSKLFKLADDLDGTSKSQDETQQAKVLPFPNKNREN